MADFHWVKSRSSGIGGPARLVITMSHSGRTEDSICNTCIIVSIDLHIFLLKQHIKYGEGRN